VPEDDLIGAQFAGLTALFEDGAGWAAEGQRPDLADAQRFALRRQIESAVADATVVMVALRTGLGAS
jgi:hypothetical protein